jgi:hypothetical protein
MVGRAVGIEFQLAVARTKTPESDAILGEVRKLRAERGDRFILDDAPAERLTSDSREGSARRSLSIRRSAVIPRQRSKQSALLTGGVSYDVVFVGRRESKAITFTTPGTQYYIFTPHPWMYGEIIVEP